MIVNRSDIINSVSKANNLNYSDIEFSIKKLIDFMSSNLYRGERIEIRGFGSFSIRYRNPIRGRNPKTGSSVELGKRRIPYFRAAKALNFKINH